MSGSETDKGVKKDQFFAELGIEPVTLVEGPTH